MTLKGPSKRKVVQIDFPLFLFFHLAIALQWLIVSISVYWYMKTKVAEVDLMKFYALSWMLIPCSSVITTRIIVKFLRDRFVRPEDSISIYLACMVVLDAIVLSPGNTEALGRNPFLVILVLLVGHACPFGLILGLKDLLNRIQGKVQVKDFLVAFSAVFIGVWILLTTQAFHDLAWHFSNFFFLAVLMVVFILYWRIRIARGITNPALRFAGELAVVFFLCLIFIDPSIPTEPHHESFFLGPISDVLAGKTLLVNIHSQYGLLNIYVLSLPFLLGLLPLTYEGLIFLNQLAMLFQYILLYFILCHLSKSRHFAKIALLIILIVHYFCGLDNSAFILSTGPFRFSLIYYLLSFMILRQRFVRYSKILFVFEMLVAGLSLIWSFETAVYTLPAYILALWCECWIKADSVRKWFYECIKKTCPVFVSGLGFGIGLVVLTKMRSGVWPDWELYFSYIKLYGIQGFVALPMPVREYWWGIVFVLYGGLSVIILNLMEWRLRRFPLFPFVVAFTVTGVAQFTYYIGRSFIYSLSHVSIPSLVLMMCGISCLRNFSELGRKSVRLVLYTMLVSLTVLLVQVGIPKTVEKIKRNWKSSSSIFNYVSSIYQHKADPELDDAIKLIMKYCPRQQRVPILTDEFLATRICMRMRIANAFQFNNILQTIINPYTRRQMFSEIPLRNGDFVFMQRNSGDEVFVYVLGKTFKYDFLKFLKTRFIFELVESSPLGFSVYKVQSIDKI